MKKRKLLPQDVLERLHFRYSIGVPVSKLYTEYSDDISLPTFTRLIQYFEESTDNEQSVSITNTIQASLFPPWLDPNHYAVQEQPKDWNYLGRFPVGKWMQTSENN